VTVDAALERWIKTIRSSRNNDNTLAKYQTMARQIAAWTRPLGLAKLHEISTDLLDEWITTWAPTAECPQDRIGKTTAGRRLEMVKRFFKYCVRMNWIGADPTADFDAIAPDESITLPLLSGRYEAVLEATYRYDEEMRSDDRFGLELRALIELMRWSGLRIGDALRFPRSALRGNRLTVTIQKSGRKKKQHTVIVPDQVCKALLDLPARPTTDPNHFFWSGTSKHKSLTSQWQRKLQRLNQYLTLVDYEGKPMRFHSHQLRDTFAVNHLLAGTSMQDLSLMLAHESIKVTEKYYAPWVPERQAALELKMAEALAAMGATVTN
jgi:site-specific recombinase XerD